MADSKPEMETSSDDLDKQCDACRNAGETKLATVFCKTCRQFQCDTCSDMHKRLPTLSDHSVVDIQDIEEDKVIDMKGVDICKTHNNEIKFYCKTHAALCCDKCIISDHLKCNDVGELGEFTQSNAENLKHLQRRIQTRLFTISVDQSTIPRVQVRLKKEQEDGLQELGEIKGKITRAFTMMRGKFRSKTDSAVAATCKRLESKMAQNRQQVDKLRSIETFINNVATEGTPEQCFNVLCVIGQDLDKLLLEDQESLSTCKININFNDTLIALANVVNQIATVSIEKIDVYAPLTPHSPLWVDIQQVQGEWVPLITGLDFLFDGRIVAVDNHNQKVYIFDSMLKKLNTIKMDGKPFDATVMSDDQVAISSSKAISIYKLKTDNSFTRVKQVNTKEPYYSVTAVDDQTLVAGTYNCDIPAKLVTLKGEEKDFDVPLPTRKYEFDQSRSAYIPSLNMLVLTDKQSNKCHLWHMKGGIETIIEDDRIKSPRGMCATSSGHIFICCYDSRLIVQLSPTGKVINCTSVSTIWREPPISVAVSRDGKKLAVSIFDDQQLKCKLKIYKLT